MARETTGMVDPEALAMEGCPFSDFTVEAQIGVTTVALLVDTGSSTLAVAGESCTSCTGVSPRWSASHLSMHHQQTAAGQYGDGSGWRADVWSDRVRIGTTNQSATDMRIAVITSQSTKNYNADGSYAPGVDSFFFVDHCFDRSNSYLKKVMLQGILGMAFAQLASPHTDSFPVQLFASHPSLPPVFAIQMCTLSGQLWIGGTDPDSYVGEPLFTAVSPAQLYWTVAPSDMYIDNTSLGLTPAYFQGSSGYTLNIIDSGTTMWELPDEVYDRIVAALLQHPAFQTFFRSAPNNNFFNHGTGYCEAPLVPVSAQTLQQVLPTLSLQFANGLTLTMDGVGSYLLPCTNQLNYWTPGIGPGSMGMIGGWPLMNQFVTIHDMAQVRIGFAPVRSCSTGLPPLRTRVAMGPPIVSNPHFFLNDGSAVAGQGGQNGLAGLVAWLCALFCIAMIGRN
jgi:hypothetical protein